MMDSGMADLHDVDVDVDQGGNDPDEGEGSESSASMDLLEIENLSAVSSSDSTRPCTDGISNEGKSSLTKTCVAKDEVDDADIGKLSAIDKALENSDVTTLKQLAVGRGGLLSNAIRKRAWPCLLGADAEQCSPKPDLETLKKHRDYHQVVLDVNRSVKRFPPGMQEQTRLSYQDQLVSVIVWILHEHPELHYYQGFHDVVVTFLLVIGEELTFIVVKKLVKLHLREFLDKTMERTRYKLHYLYPIIGKADQKLLLHLEEAEVGTIFCLSWLITWFGHTLDDFKKIVRLYDFFIACHPLMPVYLAAAIVVHRRTAVLDLPPEMPIIHSLLSHIPPKLPLEQLIQIAGDLFLQYPPQKLDSQAIEAHLKTIRKEEKDHRESVYRVQLRRKQEARKRFQERLCSFSVWGVAVVAGVAAVLWSVQGWVTWESSSWFVNSW